MIFEQVRINGDKNFGYVVGDEQSRRVAAVDPGTNPDALMGRIHEIEADCIYVLATHSHYDHVAGVDVMKKKTGAPFAAYKTVPGVDEPLDDGDVLRIDGVPIRAVHCPGHCADSLLLVANEEKCLLGDELFIGGCGITHSEEQARTHYENLHNKLLALDDAIEVYPGHDYGAKPSSTVGEQRRTNPYLLQPDFESFWWLRRHWKEYCRDHGIDWG